MVGDLSPFLSSPMNKTEFFDSHLHKSLFSFTRLFFNIYITTSNINHQSPTSMTEPQDILMHCGLEYLQILQNSFATQDASSIDDNAPTIKSHYQGFKDVVERHCETAQLSRRTASQISTYVRTMAKQFDHWKIARLSSSVEGSQVRAAELEKHNKTLHYMKQDMAMEMGQIRAHIDELNKELEDARSAREMLDEQIFDLQPTVWFPRRPGTLLNVLRTACQTDVFEIDRSELRLSPTHLTFRDASNRVARWYRDHVSARPGHAERVFACNEFANSVAHDRSFHPQFRVTIEY
jgi:hypothetical protein